MGPGEPRKPSMGGLRDATYEADGALYMAEVSDPSHAGRQVDSERAWRGYNA